MDLTVMCVQLRLPIWIEMVRSWLHYKYALVTFIDAMQQFEK